MWILIVFSGIMDWWDIMKGIIYSKFNIQNDWIRNRWRVCIYTWFRSVIDFTWLMSIVKTSKIQKTLRQNFKRNNVNLM